MTYLDNPDLLKKLQSIRAVVFDVDGVLTDGRLYYGSEGEATKVFHVRDGVGLKLLADQGIKVAVMTAKDSAMVARRVKDLGITHYFAGVKDKAEQLQIFAESIGIESSEACFVGDDMVDLPAMALCGVSICPADGYEYVRDQVDHVAALTGGSGVARYVCDMVLRAKGLYEQAYKVTMTPHFERNR